MSPFLRVVFNSGAMASLNAPKVVYGAWPLGLSPYWQ
jgi:hypothetical protein